MATIGLCMVGIAIVMFIVARPRNGEVVPWLHAESLQWAYIMTIVVLISIGGAVALHG